MKDIEALALLDKYKAGTCNEEEKAKLESWYLQWNDEDLSFEEDTLITLKNEMWAAMPKAEVKRTLRSHLVVYKRRVIVAASIVFAVSAGLWLYVSEHSPLNPGLQIVNRHDLAPGKNKAMITLSDGKHITLSDVKSGVVIDAGKFTYNDGSAVEINPAEIPDGSQTVTTPKGGTYQVILPDGSKVQLNAASSIKFASNFGSLAQRRIELIGEAYFEVAKDKRRPFVVKSKNQEVEVLGTHFNVSAYGDEQDTKTTLLEGAIQINNQLLRPNQQAIQINGRIDVREVSAIDAIDWKNGEFICRNEPLESIMRKIARWYDVKVVYASPELRNMTFSGSLSRYDHVVDVLKALGFAGTMKFKLEDRTIQVL